jgi:hydroxymethylpyrimidine kinase/phosphomethylpyrimidine kinase
VKSFSALGLHATAVVTAIGDTALDATTIGTQLDAVLGPVRVDVVKLTCPANAATLEVIAGAIARNDVQKLVLDPADSVDDADSLEVLKARLLPLTYVAIPNLTEAQTLTGRRIETWDDMRDAALAIAAMGPANVVIKGGKRDGQQATDILYDGADYRDYTAERVQLLDIRGAGTTFAAAVTATLAKGETVQHSIAAGKAYVTKALQSTYDLGGSPALHHFYRYWRPTAQ